MMTDVVGFFVVLFLVLYAFGRVMARLRRDERSNGG